MNILGISAFYHDSAAALVQEGRVTAAAQEERFSRVKQDAAFPAQAIRFCLDHAGLNPNEIDQIVFYDKPFLKFERLLETYYSFAPKGIKSFWAAMPVWIKEKLFLRRLLLDELSSALETRVPRQKLLFSEHHLSHAASAFFPSPFAEAAVLTIDGVGEWATTGLFHGRGGQIEALQEMHFPHSWGLLYSAFTYYLGFKVNSGEYKLMGLAPYGDANAQQTKDFVRQIKDELISLKEDGSVWLNLDYFDYPVGMTMTHDARWQRLFGLARRQPESEIGQQHMNLAFAIQQVVEEGVLRLARNAKKKTGSPNLCLAGGVALNCVANGRIIAEEIFERVWIQPAAGDAGGALGAALGAWHIAQGQERITNGQRKDSMQGAYLGPQFGPLEVERCARSFGAPYQRFDQFDALCGEVAGLLEEGKVVGWFQGRMEWGPRALGNRSILGDARSPEMQKRLNLKIKYRESFRPFAPSVLAEDAEEYFDLPVASPYMLLVGGVKQARCANLPDDFSALALKEKLYTSRSDIPAVTHLDFSARVQTVHRESNPRYHQLLSAFKARTGYGVIVNTSFNVRGEPIVCTPEDAYRCFMRTEMDWLVIGDYLFEKSKQPPWQERESWREDYPLD